MWAQGVTPEFANEIRQWYAAASPNDLVGMRVNGVTAEFARQVRQSDPSASIEDVISMRTQGVPSNGQSNSLRIYRSTPPKSTNLPRTWSIEARTGQNGASPDRVQLKFLSSSGVQSTTVSFNPSVFRGLPTEQIMSATQTMVRFDIVRDAGTFACEGYFRDGRGSGTFVFQPNPEFRARMQALGIQDIHLLNALHVQTAQGRIFATGETDITAAPTPGPPSGFTVCSPISLRNGNARSAYESRLARIGSASSGML